MAAAGAEPVAKPCVLIVEDAARGFFEALVGHLGLTERFQVVAAKGKNNVRDQIEFFKDHPTVRALGVIRDAHADPAAVAASIRDGLKLAGFPAPAGPSGTEGAGNRKAAFLVLPGGDRPGEIEHLLLDAVESDQAVECVDAYFQCLDAKGVATDKDKLHKAKIRAFLASREKQDKSGSLSVAAWAGVWPWDNPVFDAMKTMLRELAQ